MAHYYRFRYLNNFDRVAACYESIKPVNGSRIKVWYDIRPLGDRKRQYERIKKVSDTEYHLIDGSEDWGWVVGSTSRFEAPAIIWRRTPEGDFVTVRQNFEGRQSAARVAFINRYLPSGMHLVHRNRGMLNLAYTPAKDARQETAPLPKVNKDGTNAPTMRYVSDGVFERVNRYEIKTTRLDKAKKAVYKDRFDQMFNHAVLTMPIVLYDRRDSYYMSIPSEFYQQLHKATPDIENYGALRMKAKLYALRDVVDDPMHELYTAYVAVLVSMSNTLLSGLVRNVDPKKLKSLFNRIVRDVFKLNSYVEV